MNTMFCDICRKSFENLKECPTCDGEVLLDLNDPKVRQILEDQDDRDQRKRLTHFTFASMVAASPIPVGAVVMDFRAGESLVLYGIVVMAMTKFLGAKFPAPRRFSIPE